MTRYMSKRTLLSQKDDIRIVKIYALVKTTNRHYSQKVSIFSNKFILVFVTTSH